VNRWVNYRSVLGLFRFNDVFRFSDMCKAGLLVLGVLPLEAETATEKLKTYKPPCTCHNRNDSSRS
jgi:hypothetical protein